MLIFRAIMQTMTPCNAVTGKRYNSINSMNLIVKSLDCGYFDDPRWFTYRQANAEGWTIKRGARGLHIEFYKQPKIVLGESRALHIEQGVFDADCDPGRFGEYILVGGPDVTAKTQVTVKNSVVFHASQIEGIPPYDPEPMDKNAKAEMDRTLQQIGS